MLTVGPANGRNDSRCQHLRFLLDFREPWSSKKTVKHYIVTTLVQLDTIGSS